MLSGCVFKTFTAPIDATAAACVKQPHNPTQLRPMLMLRTTQAPKSPGSATHQVSRDHATLAEAAEEPGTEGGRFAELQVPQGRKAPWSCSTKTEFKWMRKGWDLIGFNEKNYRKSKGNEECDHGLLLRKSFGLVQGSNLSRLLSPKLWLLFGGEGIWTRAG